jgi:hypothetical protein
MQNIYSGIRKLAKSIKAQNTFSAAKELQSIHLFYNTIDFSRLQELYLSFLYIYDSINKDIVTDKISKHIFDSEVYEDAYLIWKRKGIKKEEKRNNTQKNVNLVSGKHIKFPVKEKI